MINVRGIGPAAFLKLVSGASFVCTDSFHGACFSMNFNKSFVVKTSDSAVQSNVRITDLLARYGIEGCLYRDEVVTTAVDYGHANQALSHDRDAARAFIARCIGL